jgi:hypothetical protein
MSLSISHTAVFAVAGLSIAVAGLAEAEEPSDLPLQSLPPEWIRPLEVGGCSCSTFRAEKLLSIDRVLLSTGGFRDPARIRIDKKNIELTHRNFSKSKGTLIHRYSGESMRCCYKRSKLSTGSSAQPMPIPRVRDHAFRGGFRSRMRERNRLSRSRRSAVAKRHNRAFESGRAEERRAAQRER